MAAKSITTRALISTESGTELAPSATDFAPLIAEWHAALDRRVAAGELAPTTRSAYTIGAAKFIVWAQTQLIAAVTRDTIRDWIAALRTAGHKPGSINTWLSGLRAFYAWALAEHRLTSDPTAGLKGARRKGTTRQHKRAALTDREVVRVLRQPDTNMPLGIRDKAILALMAYTAARTIEVHRADLADLKSEAGQMVLHVQGKGRDEKDELIVIDNPAAAGALHDWLSVRDDHPGPLFVSLSDRSRGERLSLRALRHMIKSYYLAAGVLGKDKTTHSLRHAAISNALRHGAPVQKVAAMARHASIETTMIYFHEIDRLSDPAERYISYNGTDGDKGTA
jgi:integrase/recombinase XerD